MRGTNEGGRVGSGGYSGSAEDDLEGSLGEPVTEICCREVRVGSSSKSRMGSAGTGPEGRERPPGNPRSYSPSPYSR